MFLFVILIVLGVLLLWYHDDLKRCSGMPPGPWRLPFAGNLIQIAMRSNVPSIALHKLAKIYGDVMHIRIGMVDFVVLSSQEGVTEFLSSEHSIHKTSFKITESRNLNGNYGLILSNGSVWQNLRRFTIRTMRDYGFGKSASMDLVLNHELNKFLAHFQLQIESSPERIVLFENTFHLSVVNVLWRLVSGKTYELNDAKMLTLLRLSDDFFASGTIADVSVAYPWVAYWFPKLTSFEAQVKSMTKLKEFLLEMVQEHKVAGTYLESPSCLIDAFLQKIDEGKEEEFTYDQLLYVLLDLFQAGSETTSTTISFALLYMIAFPHVQHKMGKEIEKNIDPDEPITIGMRGRLPYVHAVILETMRFASIIPTPPPRDCSADIKIRGHTLKKDIPVMFNLYSANMQGSTWSPDPTTFRPERFLGVDDQIDSKMAEKLIVFGGGKRICLGQSMAEANLFIYIVSFCRKFKLEKVDGREPIIEPKVGLTFSPQPFYAKIVERNINK